MVDLLENFKTNTLAEREPLRNEETLASARAELEELVGPDTTIESFFPAFESEEFRAVVGVALTSAQLVVKTDGVTTFGWDGVRNVKRYTSSVQPGGEKAERKAEAKADVKRGLRYPFYTVPFIFAGSFLPFEQARVAVVLAAMLVSLAGVAFSAKSAWTYFAARRMDPPEPVSYAVLEVELDDTEISAESRSDGYGTRTEVSEERRRLRFYGYPEEIPENVQRLAARHKLE
jgi:uncharacterized membrane protein